MDELWSSAIEPLENNANQRNSLFYEWLIRRRQRTSGGAMKEQTSSWISRTIYLVSLRSIPKINTTFNSFNSRTGGTGVTRATKTWSCILTSFIDNAELWIAAFTLMPLKCRQSNCLRHSDLCKNRRSDCKSQLTMMPRSVGGDQENHHD